ncbi:MAG: hypothetical protein C4K58_03920 [Flavobacteriaceae bacterium]|nr:MAG: hypothetical protein C4K58_03920 [Flavobacteriaceae bacterium]
MKNKILALFLIHALQFLALACAGEDVDCPRTSTYETNITSIVLTPLSSSLNEIKPNSNPKKSDFSLSIRTQVDKQKIAKVETKFNFGDFGFAKTYATTCASDKYYSKDPIESIQVLATNTATNETTNVTDHFIYQYINDYNFMNSKVIENSFPTKRDDYTETDYFQIGLYKTTNIPDSAIFTVTLTLESGNLVSQKTTIINFN